jgi:putative transcriptional regulator
VKNKIKELRLQYGITQLELSSLVHVSTRTIISLEGGKFKPSIMLAYRIAKVFNTSIEDLYFLEEAKKMEDEAYEGLQG